MRLSQAGVSLPNGKIPLISAFNGKLEFVHNGVTIPQTEFILDGGHASLQSRAESIVPLRASYTFTAESVKLPHLIAARPANEVVNQLKLSGAAYGSFAAPSLNMTIGSSNGRVADLSYRDQTLTALSVYPRGPLRSRFLPVRSWPTAISSSPPGLNSTSRLR